jgi:PAS domain-containing protein
VQDETDPKHSEERLRASELNYRRLFETAKDGILILDAKTGKVTDANPFLVNLLGYSLDELIGAQLWEIGPFKDIKECKLAFAELQEKEYIRFWAMFTFSSLPRQRLYRFCTADPADWHFWHFSALEEPITYVESMGCKVRLPPPPPLISFSIN